MTFGWAHSSALPLGSTSSIRSPLGYFVQQVANFVLLPIFFSEKSCWKKTCLFCDPRLHGMRHINVHLPLYLNRTAYCSDHDLHRLDGSLDDPIFSSCPLDTSR